MHKSSLMDDAINEAFLIDLIIFQGGLVIPFYPFPGCEYQGQHLNSRTSKMQYETRSTIGAVYYSHPSKVLYFEAYLN